MAGPSTPRWPTLPDQRETSAVGEVWPPVGGAGGTRLSINAQGLAECLSVRGELYMRLWRQ